MDKLRRVLNGEEDGGEAGLVTSVGILDVVAAVPVCILCTAFGRGDCFLSYTHFVGEV